MIKGTLDVDDLKVIVTPDVDLLRNSLVRHHTLLVEALPVLQAYLGDLEQEHDATQDDALYLDMQELDDLITRIESLIKN